MPLLNLSGRIALLHYQQMTHSYRKTYKGDDASVQWLHTQKRSHIPRRCDMALPVIGWRIYFGALETGIKIITNSEIILCMWSIITTLFKDNHDNLNEQENRPTKIFQMCHGCQKPKMSSRDENLKMETLQHIETDSEVIFTIPCVCAEEYQM